MSALQPVIASEPRGRISPPSFSVVMRGYHRKQVQSFIDDLFHRLTAARQRADATERAITQMRLEIAAVKNQPPSFEDLGAEAAAVLARAGSSAKLLVEEARGRGDVIVHKAETDAAELIRNAELRVAELEQAAGARLDEAKREGARIIAEAEASAERLRARCSDEAEVIRQKVFEEHAGLVAETDRLHESRGWLLEYFARINSYLDGLLSESTADQQTEDQQTEDQQTADQQAADQLIASDETNGHGVVGGSELAAQPASRT